MISWLWASGLVALDSRSSLIEVCYPARSINVARAVLNRAEKSAWRQAKNDKQHDEKFITSGLWGVSRHPK